LRKTTLFPVKPRVSVDNDLSNQFSVIEVEGLDRPGLLSDVTGAISDLNLDIRSAHISTYGEKVVDVFYVTDLIGTKITSETRIERIEARLTMQEGIATVTAPSGRYDLEAEKLNVLGPVVFHRPDGYVLQTGDVAVSLPTRKVTSVGRVSGRMPLGSFSASRLDADMETRVVTLSGGVKMRITQR